MSLQEIATHASEINSTARQIHTFKQYF